MTYGIVVTAILSAFLLGISYGAENIYTWRDKQGVLNITDYAPPKGAEIIDIRPSHRIEAGKLQRERLNRLEEYHDEQARQKDQEQLAQLRKIEQEALKTAEEALEKAKEQISRSNRTQDRERTRIIRNKAARYAKEHREALARAENARKQAEILKERLASSAEGSPQKKK